MVDEKEDRYEGEEGEYHFSDDQINYEETETPKTSQSTETTKKSILEKLSGLSPGRRMILAGVVFMSLIGIVYKMLIPSTPSLPAEISQITPASKTVQPLAAAKPVVPVAPPPATVPGAAPAAATPEPTSAAPIINPPGPQAPTITPETAAAIPPGAPVAPPAETAQAVPQAAMYPPTQAAAPPPAAPPTTGTAPPPVTAVLPPNVADRVKAVEDHNTAIMNLLQTEYAQKMSEFEMQSNLVRGKMDEMAKRVNRIESSLNQITQMLQQNAPPTAARGKPPLETAIAVPARPNIPKVVYTVQAIIPGRAWLKADSGDTVTVAEGDILRDWGRITKIDPYDGVVEIDTGNKVIALSYGMSAE